MTALLDRMETIVDHLRPSLAATATSLATSANIAVWRDLVRDWSAVTVALLAIPTAFCMMIYWMLKTRREIIDLKSNSTDESV